MLHLRWNSVLFIDQNLKMLLNSGGASPEQADQREEAAQGQAKPARGTRLDQQ
jgi:hypothetical protein